MMKNVHYKFISKQLQNYLELNNSIKTLSQAYMNLNKCNIYYCEGYCLKKRT